MSDEAVSKWWIKSDEYRCQSCQGLALGYQTLSRSVPFPPEQVQNDLSDWPFEVTIDPWKNGDGCTVIFFPEQYAKYRESNPIGNLDAGAGVLMCTECHARTLIDKANPPKLYWMIDTRHGVLWAHNRQHLAAIFNYIQLEHRPQSFVKLPGWMISAKNRNELVKLIKRALERGPCSKG